MTVRHYAESILLANTLEEKLIPPPADLTLDPPQRGTYLAPALPGRPEHLLPRKANDSRTKIPSAQQLSNDSHRATLLHFFCNHELLAVELMALALLKFPDAPDAFRRGLLRTLTEEQEHTRLYLERMNSVGITFGEHHLSSMIWDHIATMESPLEYVSRLSLTFEQANLDYAKHYSQAFHQAGDQDSATLLAKIYKDEIAHVGYGLKWLRRFKDQKESDWDAWHRSLTFPLSPIRAKGSVPFNREGRLKAGLNDDFIQQLAVFQRSRGRTPIVHHFNPNCESHLAATLRNTTFQPTKSERHLQQDLKLLLLANAHPDDVVLVEQPPSQQHLTQLLNAGLELPEFTTLSQLKSRKLGGFRPWAWTPDATTTLSPLSTLCNQQSNHPFETALPPANFSKELTVRTQQHLNLPFSKIASSLVELEELLTNTFPDSPVIIKAALACAGKNQLRLAAQRTPPDWLDWATKRFTTQPSLIIEPLLPRTRDFSALYDFPRNSEPRLLAFTLLETDPNGRYLGTTSSPKFASLLTPEEATLFHQTTFNHTSLLQFYKRTLPNILKNLLPHFHGPLAVDALFFQHPGKPLAIHPLVEINPRCTMGRIAHNLRLKLHPNQKGTLTIHRRKNSQFSIKPGDICLNDPAAARSYLATWSATPSERHLRETLLPPPRSTSSNS
ncbi:MAG: DUF455 family protein [Verrucomicrobiota bacterium]